MDAAWRDHHHARDQTWRTIQMVAVLAAGLMTVDVQFANPYATSSAGLLVLLSALVGMGITYNHRKLERRKFIHLMNCEEWLGLHREDLIPLREGLGESEDRAGVVDGAVSVPDAFRFPAVLLDLIDPRKQNTSLFIIRMHAAIAVFSLIICIARLLQG